MFAVYVSGAESGDISVLRLDPASGAIAVVQTIEPGGELMPMALGPSLDRLYVARRSEPREALSFAIDRRSGRLSPLGNAALPHSMAYIAADHSGRWLFSASYGGNLVAVNAIDAQGIVRETVQVEATGPKAHAILPDATNRRVLATSLGGGVITQFDFDPMTGRLSARATVSPHQNASPRHFRFSPDQRFVYLLNELDGALDVLGYENGRLTPVQKISTLTTDFSGEPWAADLQLTPDGRYLYASERRSSQLARFRVDPASGHLELLGHTATEPQPRGFRITPDGRYLISVGQLSQRLRLFEIDPRTGALSVRGEAPVGRGANWVEVMPLLGEVPR
ncbi:lactonase family protein [Pelomonas sp. KK5]|uniref:lactonase family protein n=1 Tax=Pelomonas sp. KK5 TaxID=1855730 RepID=UPI00097C9EC2|nr:lactonase family protein [Pelomonas sp. KK5]